MDFDKKTVFAFILIGLILILMQTEFYQERFLPQAPPQPIEENQPPVSEQRQNQPLAEQSGFLDREESGSAGEGSGGEKRTVLGSEMAEPELIHVETDLYRAVLSSQGATIRSWSLKEYFVQDSSQVQLVGGEGAGNLALLLPTFEDTIDTSPYVFEVNKKSINLTGSRAQERLVFTLKLDENSTIKKTYTFYQDKYSVDLKVELLNLHDFIDGFSYYLTWKTGLESTEPDFKLEMDKAKAYAYQGDAESFDVNDDFDVTEWDNPTDWVAIRTKYFAVALIPRSAQGQGVKFSGTSENVGQEVPLKRYRFDLQMPFDGKRKRTDEFTVYLGPLDYEIVKSYNVDLEEMMDLGWAIFKPFGKFILWSFTALYKVIPNYGWVIVIFSILIKIVLYPLTRKSSRSMKEMQSLQPLMQEINEKYKNDAQKKQQEIMKLYKEHGVNPLGGCIPMILQMPLLIALFQIFQSTIQLRGAPFIGWITDLSRPDTIAHLPFSVPMYGDTVNILPLFMGVTMFIQQKMTMKDPKQKAMVYIMPVVFTLLFNRFPSGLNLYYSLFNLFSILQDKLIPYHPKSAEEMKKRKNSKARGRRIKHDYRGRTYKKS